MFESYNNDIPSISLDVLPAEGNSESCLLFGLMPASAVIPPLSHALHSKQPRNQVTLRIHKDDEIWMFIILDYKC